jgi:hypothetical protein
VADVASGQVTSAVALDPGSAVTLARSIESAALVAEAEAVIAAAAAGGEN